VHAEWHHSARSAALRSSYLSPEEAADLALEERAEAHFQRLLARESLAQQGVDVSETDAPMLEEYEQASRESGKAGFAAIIAALRRGSGAPGASEEGT
jgi:hypothetical protein